MSGDSSLGIGIGLALKSYGRGLTYVKTDRALDLGNLEPFTIPDLSGNANTATLNSGIYVYTNGTTDKAVGANETALGSGNYYLSGKIKPAGTTAKTTMNGSTASNLTGLTAGVWQDFQTATASAITPSSINLGWDGTAFNATVDNWSDVKLHDASDDSVVAHYKLYDSANASLNGYPVLDCVGGYHGAHVGCAGGASEASILQTAGEDFNKYPWFDGVDDNIDFGAGDALSFHGSAKVEYCGYIYVLKEAPLVSYTVFSTYLNVGSVGFSVAISAANTLRVSGRSSLADSFLNLTTAISEGWHYIKCYADYANDQLGISIDNAAYITSVAAFASSVYTYNTSTQRTRIGDASGSAGTSFIGIIHDSEILLDDTPISLTGGTVNGSPSLYHVAESETTAGIDALGTAIVNPRPNERVLNLTTGTGYATVADNDSLDLGTSSLVTQEFWIKIEDGSVNHRIIDKGSPVNGIGLQYISSISSIRVTLKTQSSPSSTWDGATDIADGQWHHIIVRLNNRRATPVAGDVSIFIDGADDSATLFSSSSNLTATLTNAEPLNIGLNDEIPTQKLIGQIGDVRQYDRALTADEVLKNYNARKGAYGL